MSRSVMQKRTSIVVGAIVAAAAAVAGITYAHTRSAAATPPKAATTKSPATTAELQSVKVAIPVPGQATVDSTVPGEAGAPYEHMNHLAPIGVRTGKYLDVHDSAKGPAIDPAKGYRVEELGTGLYMITDNGYSSMFMVYETGVVLLDVPQPYAGNILAAVREITPKPITHIIYSHHHADHIAGTKGIGGNPVIIAHEETKRLLVEANDPDRPLPTRTFKDKYTLKVGSQTLELSYHGVAHEPGNVFIYAPRQKVLMVVDIVFPGWMPWRRLALAQDIRGVFRQLEEIKLIDFDKLVGGHVSRWGTKADVQVQLDFMNDLRSAAATALKTTKFTDEINPADAGNAWAAFDNFIDRVANQCMNTLEPSWKTRLAGYDTFIWDQCYAMEQSLRID
jgi:glyoxylase-like metal-dependent hydrolase (beta-lactamase superfamily II)